MSWVSCSDLMKLLLSTWLIWFNHLTKLCFVTLPSFFTSNVPSLRSDLIKLLLSTCLSCFYHVSKLSPNQVVIQAMSLSYIVGFIKLLLSRCLSCFHHLTKLFLLSPSSFTSNVLILHSDPTMFFVSPYQVVINLPNMY
jgi:hypothetical protein